jgi:Family of unknown function (DUF6328)
MSEVSDSAAIDEEAAARLARNMSELLQELRVVQSGVQILFAFLLTLPFTARFARVTDGQRDAYLAALLLAGAAVAFLIAPTAYHRIIFHHHDKRHLIKVSSFWALCGLVMLALAMTIVTGLVVDLLLGGAATLIATLSALTLFGTLWFAVPIHRRMTHGGDQFGPRR